MDWPVNGSVSIGRPVSQQAVVVVDDGADVEPDEVCGGIIVVEDDEDDDCGGCECVVNVFIAVVVVALTTKSG